jgi:hypothetical protein
LTYHYFCRSVGAVLFSVIFFCSSINSKSLPFTLINILQRVFPDTSSREPRYISLFSIFIPIRTVYLFSVRK